METKQDSNVQPSNPTHIKHEESIKGLSPRAREAVGLLQACLDVVSYVSFSGQKGAPFEDDVLKMATAALRTQENQGEARSAVIQELLLVLTMNTEAASSPPPEGSASCPVCLSCYLDADHAANCCEEDRECCAEISCEGHRAKDCPHKED